MWKKRIITSLWVGLGIGVCVLLTAGVRHKKQLTITGIKVNIERVKGHVFVDENDIALLLTNNGASAGNTVADLPLHALEQLLEKQPWIYSAQLFIDNNQTLVASIEEREPLARIFTLQGTSFYIDSSGMQLPLSHDYSARVPMFTGFTSNKKKLSKPDSLLLEAVKKIATVIAADSFWMAQVSQVNITSRNTFEIVPVLGNQLIKLGNADSLQSKFDRLTAFYKQVWAKNAFEKYETISVEYSRQIVAVKRGMPPPVTDSAQAAIQMQDRSKDTGLPGSDTTAKAARRPVVVGRPL